jgi:hypothetical protein
MKVWPAKVGQEGVPRYAKKVCQGVPRYVPRYAKVVGAVSWLTMRVDAEGYTCTYVRTCTCTMVPWYTPGTYVIQDVHSYTCTTLC